MIRVTWGKAGWAGRTAPVNARWVTPPNNEVGATAPGATACRHALTRSWRNAAADDAAR